MTNVLVVGPFKEEQRKRIEEAGKGCSFRFCADFAGAGVSPGEIASADVIIGNLIPTLIKESPRLKLMQLTSAGADAYVKPGVLAKGIPARSGSYPRDAEKAVSLQGQPERKPLAR